MDPKRKAVKAHKENEAIQFDFDITADDFDEIASEMMKSGLILEEDSRAVAKLLKVQVYTLLKDRKERIAQAETAAREKEMAKFQQALEQHHQQILQQQQAQTQTSSEGEQSQQQQTTTSQINSNIQVQQQQQQQMQQISPQPLLPISQQQQMQNNNQSPMIQPHQVTPNLMPNQPPINLNSTPNQQQTPLKPSDAATIQQVTPTNILQHQQSIQKLPQMQAGSMPIASPAVNQELSQQLNQQAAKTPQLQAQPHTMDSGIGTSTPQSTSSTSSTMKKRRSAKSSDRYPKLVVLGLIDEKVVECEMEVKPKTVTFKFDVFEVNPDEVAKDLVKFYFIFFIIKF